MDQYQAMTEQKDYEPGKIFVGGLSWETSKESLQAYFEKYGEITDSVIMVEGTNRRPRGFGFVTFKDPASVEAVLSATTPHVLDTKTVDPKRAAKKGGSMGGAGAGGGGQQSCAKKVFVGGIANGTTEDDVRGYFSQFGQVINLDLKYDKVTQRMRGFGFVEFESEDVVEKLCQGHFHQLNGKTVEVKKAESRYASSQGFTQRGGAHQPYGGNIGRGGYNYGVGGGGYSSSYGGYGYGHQQQQPQQQQQQQYGGYGYGSYGSGQSGGYGQQATGYDYSSYGSQQPASGSEQPRSDSSYYYAQQQQQYQDGTGYGGTPRTSYSTGTESYGYGQQAAAYHYDTTPTGYNAGGCTADSQPSTGYGRGAGQQRGGTTYHYPSH